MPVELVLTNMLSFISIEISTTINKCAAIKKQTNILNRML